MAKIATTFGIEIITTAPQFPIEISHGQIDGKEASQEKVRRYSVLFIQEFTLYPADLVKRSKLKRIVLCTDLTFQKQWRNALPDFEHDALYLDVNRGMHSKSYLRKVIHHEFFHVLDYQDDGHVYADERWTAINPAGFKYGNGGRNSQDEATTSVATDKYPGFLNHYSTMGVEEDKAELFAHLLVDGNYVTERAAHDPVLKAKVGRLRELLANFCPDVNGPFWEKARKLERVD